MLILSLQPLARLSRSLQPLERLADFLLGWLDDILYRSFDIGLVRAFSAVRISIPKLFNTSYQFINILFSTVLGYLKRVFLKK